MRICMLLGCLWAAASLQAAEPFVAPSFVKELKDLEQAKKEAADSHKGITFLLMEPGST